VRIKAELALGNRLAGIGQQMVQFVVDENHFDIPLLLSQYPERDRSVFSVTGLSRGGGKAGANAYRALNIRREYFVDYAIRVIIWLSREDAIDLSRHAPDFWAFRHRVVEFDDSLDPERLLISVRELSERAQGFPDRPQDVGEQIALCTALSADLPRQAGFLAARLDLFVALASLYRVEAAYDKSAQRLKQAMEIARRLDNVPLQAKLWGYLGLVYLDLDQMNRAVRACRKAIRIAPRDASLWSGLGHLYHIMKRFPDAIMAYQHVIQLDPQNPPAHSSLVACYRLLGKDNMAEEQKKLALPVMENQTEYNRAIFESVCGNTSRALELLAIALEKKQAGVNGARCDPNLDFIRDDPRFEQVLAKP